MTKNLNSMDDWSQLNNNDWDNLIQMQYLEDEEINEILDSFMNVEIDPVFQEFMDSLAPADVKEFTPSEIKQMVQQKTPSEFKLVLDKMEDYNSVVQIFSGMDEAELYNYFTSLTEADWKQTTKQEW